MRLLAVAIVASLIGLLGWAAPSLAAPENKNTVSLDVSCAELGEITVTFVGQSAGAAVFGPDGRVIVALRFAGTADVTIEIEGGPTFSFTEAFEEGARGHGFEDRLQECTFTDTFEDEFTLTRRDVMFLDLDPALVGATATVSGTFQGTAWVVKPGR